jgi:hypothetical protein
MPMGPGKYDELCTKAREEAMAAAVLMIVIGGNKGSGFSVQTADLVVLAALPAILRDLANDIEESGGRA